MDKLEEIYKLLAVLSVFLPYIDGACNFPGEWRGRWFQSGLQEVLIGKNTIHKNGLAVCKEHQRDYYLVENRARNCFQCLLVMERHSNIIQYKESYCLTISKMQELCNQIRVEAILYTLVREPAIPVRCPFQDAHHFSYNNNTGGKCRNPPSYAKPCAGDAKFKFHFKHCPDAIFTHNRDLDFECLATWKSGSDNYLYGRFMGLGVTKKDDTYRCFMYKTMGTTVFLSVSADATCRGLRSPEDGPLTMELSRDVFGWPPSSCQFPEWVQSSWWRDLSGRHVYKTDIRGEMLMVQHGKRKREEHLHTQSSFRCIKVIQTSSQETHFVAKTFASHGCASKHQCIKIIKAHANVLEIIRGHRRDFESEKCTDAEFANSTKHILIPYGMPTVPCPYTGSHKLQASSADCRRHFRSGCNGTGVIDISHSCATSPEIQLQCLSTWETGNKKYLIARTSNSDTSPANCFVFRKMGTKIKFTTDKKCNHGGPNILRGAKEFIFEAAAGKCKKAEKKPVPPPIPSGTTRKDESGNKGTAYQHVNQENGQRKPEQGSSGSKKEDNKDNKISNKNNNHSNNNNNNNNNNQSPGSNKGSCHVMLFSRLLSVLLIYSLVYSLR